ncbi:MAG: glycosyltransferase family 2 protein [Syntrophobacteraceae bacterium]
MPCKDLTVSIVAHNSMDCILKCIESVYKWAGNLDLEVWVVDNVSEDGGAEAVRERFPQARLIVNESNVGFGRANNQVLRHAKSRYCLVLNPDTIVLPGTLQGMVDFMDRNPDAGIMGCKMLNPDLSLQYSCRKHPSLMVTLSRGLGLDGHFFCAKIVDEYLMRDVPHDEVMTVDWLTGCCLMIRKEALEDVGFFDERYFLYFEDADLCYRASIHWNVYYLPHVQMIHEFQSRSRKFGNLWHKLHHARSAALFYFKYGVRGPSGRRIPGIGAKAGASLINP